MAVDDRVAILENEFKLIKGELKETLASVRDYVTSFELPPPGDNDYMMKFIDGEDEQKLIMGGAIAHNSDVSVTQQALSQDVNSPGASPEVGKPVDNLPADTPDSSTAAGTPLASPTYQAAAPDESIKKVPERTELPSGYGVPGMGYTGEEEILGRGNRGIIGEESDLSTPQVNLLSNLIRWASCAKRDIGSEQLATFLEVYGISGHLSQELKDVILHLVEITEPQSAHASIADIWSKLILELHGILTGGEAPLCIVKPFWKDGSEILPEEAQSEVAEDESADKPLKLKLVLSNGDGAEKEFSIDLSPEEGRVEKREKRSSSTSETN